MLHIHHTSMSEVHSNAPEQNNAERKQQNLQQVKNMNTSSYGSSAMQREALASGNW